MSELLRLIGALLRLRAGPQDLPYSRELLGVSLAVYVPISVIQLSPFDNVLAAVLQAVAAVVIAVCFVIGLLQMRDHTERAVQTLTALFATEAVLTLLLIGPMRALAPGLNAIAANPEATPPELPLIPALFTIAVVIWSVLVTAHILKHALNVSLLSGVGLAILQGVLINLFLAPLAGLGGGAAGG